MPVSFRSSRVRAAVLALTCAFLVALGVVPAMARHVTRHSRTLASSGEVVVYGPINATTPTGASTTTVEQFNLPPTDSARVYYLKVQNGASDGTLRVTSGSVSLNGTVFATSAELTAIANGATLTKRLDRINETENVLSATVAGPAGAKLTLTITAVVDPTFRTWGHVYTRPQGAQVTETLQFTVEAGGGAPAYLVIANGVSSPPVVDSAATVTSATITVNGVQVVGSTDLSSTTYNLTRPVTLNQTTPNTVSVKLGGTAGSSMFLQFYVTDVAPPEYYSILAKGLNVTPPVVTRDSTVRVSVGVHDRTMPRVSVIGYPVMSLLGGNVVYAGDLPLTQEGPKTFLIRATDAANNSRDTSITVIRDTQAPTVQVSSLPDTAFVTVDSAVVVAGTITDATAVTANLNGAALTINPTTHAFSTTAQLQAGVNFLTIAATDAAGNATTVVRQVTRDNSPPTLTVTAPTDSQFTNQPVSQVTGSASAAGGVRVTVQGAPATVAANGQFLANVALIEGANTITVVATGANGLSTTRTRSVTLDTIPPVLTITSPEERAYKGPYITVSGVVSETVRLTANSPYGYEVLESVSGNFSFQMYQEFGGPTEYLFGATDRAGNSVRIVRVVTFDDVPPTLTLTAPAPGAMTSSAVYRVSGLVNDLTALTLTVNGIPATVTPDSTFAADVSLVSGPNPITVVATDAAGNQSQTTGSVLRDAAPPVVTLTSPAVALTVTNSATLNVTGTATDQTGASVLVNGVAATLDGAGTFSVPVTLAEGANTVTVLVTDGAGNTTTVVRTVDLDTQAPALDVASPQNDALASGGTVSVSGTVTDAHDATVSVNGTALTVASGGAFSGSIAAPADRVVTITATDAAGNVTTVTRTLGQETSGGGLPPDPATVAPALSRTVPTPFANATSFLYSGSNPIQTGVAAGAIPAVRAAVVRGRVGTRSGTPLAGATVSILGHPELGTTRSRADGRYDMAVAGGGTITVVLQKAGYIAAQRQVPARVQNYATVEQVTLVALDTAATVIDFSAPAQVARGSRVTDATGTRQATLVFAQGTQASLVMPDGSERPAGPLTIRATEFTVGPNGPSAMPATLPAASAYTWAAELSADEAIAAGASSVKFSQPVTLLLENFIGFKVGERVPVGFYDRAAGIWVASQNGRVIQVVDTVGGVATVDVTGTGVAGQATLDSLGFTTDELRRIAQLYRPGQSLWRVQITHFTTYDCNWPNELPPDAEPPVFVIFVDDRDSQEKKCGSIIGCERQTLGEQLPVAGTGLRLTYASERTPGYRRGTTFDIPVTGATVPTSAQAAIWRVDIAGRVFSDTLPPTPNQTVHFEWDGMDAYGRPVLGKARITIDVGYAYIATYGEALEDAKRMNAFGVSGLPSPNLSLVSPNYFVTLFQRLLDRPVGGWDARSEGLGGWTLDAHHVYDAAGYTLLRGDGERATAFSTNTPTKTVAGTGKFCSSNCGAQAPGIATASPIYPQGMSAEADGGFLLADYSQNMIRKVGSDGIIRPVAGTGGTDFSGDGGPALLAGMSPASVTRAADGSIYLYDQSNYGIRRIDPNGIITTVAGNGDCGDAGDGGPATSASLCTYSGLAAGPDGSIYFVQVYPSVGDRIRRIGSDGIISTVAGDATGYCSFGTGGAPCADNVPAVTAKLGCTIRGLVSGPDGSLYFTDKCNRVIWRITPTGMLRRFAGDPAASSFAESGDGGPALSAGLASGGQYLAVGPAGDVYVSGTAVGGNNTFGTSTVRRISPDGIITTIAGLGACGGLTQLPCFVGEGRSARSTNFSIQSMVVDVNGRLLIGDGRNYKVRRLEPALPGFTATDIAIASQDGSERYQFDQAGRHLRTEDPRTGRVTARFGYDSTGMLVSVADRYGRVVRIERDGEVPTAIIAPTGQRTLLMYDPAGYLASVSSPGAGTTRFTYRDDGLLTALTEPGQAVHQFTYDAFGLLVEDAGPDSMKTTVAVAPRSAGSPNFMATATSALGHTTSYRGEQLSNGDFRSTTMNSDGTSTVGLVTTRDSTVQTLPDGSRTITQFIADPMLGQMAPLVQRTAEIMPSGLTSTTRRSRVVTLADSTNVNSPVLSMLDSVVVNGVVSTKLYDAVGRTETMRSGEGRVTLVTLDSMGRPISASTGGLATIRHRYDESGRVVESNDAGRATRMAYDQFGNLEVVTDAADGQLRMSYDSAGHVLTASAGSATTAFLYDSAGKVQSITPPGRPGHVFTYTAGGLIREYTAPGLAGVPSTTTRYRYDADQQLRAVIRPGGDSITMDYDAAGRAVRVGTADAVTTFGYDSITGLPTSVADSLGSRYTMAYDGALLKRKTLSGGPVMGTVEYLYDSFFRTAGIVFGTDTVTRAYDRDGLLRSNGALVVSRQVATGLATTATVDAVTTSYRYDSTGTVTGATTSAGATILFSYDVERDLLDRISRRIELIGGDSVDTRFAYDSAGRLATVVRGGAVIAAYEYDANGNRLVRTSDAGVEQASVDAQDRLTSSGAAQYRYTEAGELALRLVGTDTTAYHYDAKGALRWVQQPDGTRIDYLVDPLGRRIGRRVNGVLVQGFVYESELRIAAELDSMGAVRSRFVYGTGANVPDYMVRAGVRYRLVTDQIGSVRLVVNTVTGDVSQRLDYDEYGRVLSNSNPGFQPFGFGGGLLDDATGHTLFGAREYDADMGRFTTKDPSGLHGGTNVYTYAANSPVTMVDPIGLAPMFSLSGLVNASAGFGDGVAFDIPSALRNSEEQALIDRCSDAYKNWHMAGTGVTLALGFGRMLYTGLARAIPLVAARSEVITMAEALNASAMRNALKGGFRVGTSTYRLYTEAEITATYGGDAVKIFYASGRTNGLLNGVGAAAGPAALVNQLNPSCKCK